jgi:hypothetical protein
MDETNQTKKTSTFELSLYEWIFNPFEKIQGIPALIIGFFILIAIAVFADIAGLYFPGVIDCMVVEVMSPTHQGFNVGILFLQLIASCAILSVTFIFSCALLPFQLAILKDIKPIRFFSSTMLARFPYLILSIFFALVRFYSPEYLDMEAGKNITLKPSAQTMLLSSFIFLCYIWQFVTYYYAFKASSPLKEMRMYIAYALSIIVAEIAAVYFISFSLI